MNLHDTRTEAQLRY